MVTKEENQMGYVNSKKYDGVQLYKKSNGDISYYIRYKDIDDKLKRVKIGEKSKGITESYCFQKRNEILHTQRVGEETPSIVKSKRGKKILFETIAQIYFDDVSKHTTARTVYDYNSIYNSHIKPKLSKRDINSISIEELHKLQTIKSEKLAPRTVNGIINLIKSIYNHAIKKGLYHKLSPTTNIKALKVDNRREKFLETHEIDTLLKELSDNPLLYLFVKLSLSTGARLQTIINIKKKDINFSNNIITLKDIKNDSTYSGFFDDKLKELLIARADNLNVNEYIISLDGTKLTGKQIQSRLKPILDRLFNQGLDTKDSKNRVVIHTLRHTFASHLAIKGAPIYTIQKLMNHRDIEQTMRYAKLAPDSGRELVTNLY
jgi:integrase